jgi:hypothetical protein
MLRLKLNKVKRNIDCIIFWDSAMSRRKNIAVMPKELAVSLSVKVSPAYGICHINPNYIQMEINVLGLT